MKVREVIRLLEADGWYLARTRGSHRQYKHPTKKGKVTIPGQLNENIPPGTANSILRQAGLKRVFDCRRRTRGLKRNFVCCILDADGKP